MTKPTLPQTKGALLEQALLKLIGRSGYTPVVTHTGDATLCRMSGGLGVIGRGERHQIDAIADYDFSPPFSYPLRLLMEAKCWNKTIPISVVRQAVGTLKDVSEYWIPTRGDAPETGRYHYQYGVASTSRFSMPAQRYAFAQDIFLLPLQFSTFLAPLRKAITAAAAQADELEEFDRQDIRSWMLSATSHEAADVPSEGLAEAMRSLAAECDALGYVLLAGAAGGAPMLLAPSRETELGAIEGEEVVRISPPSRDAPGWRMRPASGDQRFEFSFDLPEYLVALRAQRESLGRREAVKVKASHLREIRAMFRGEDSIRMVVFRVDGPWLGRLLKKYKLKR